VEDAVVTGVVFETEGELPAETWGFQSSGRSPASSAA
jgi:hypothetical protein